MTTQSIHGKITRFLSKSHGKKQQIVTSETVILTGAAVVIYTFMAKLLRILLSDDAQLLINLFLTAVLTLIVGLLVFRRAKTSYKRAVLVTSGTVLGVLLSFSFYGVVSNVIPQIWLEWTVAYALALASVFGWIVYYHEYRARSPLSRYLIPAGMLAIFVGLMVVAITTNWHNVNPDGVSYLSIASEYAHGHFVQAVNAYWSPMISLLCVPFILLGLDPLAAFRTGVIFSAIALLGAQYLLQKELMGKLDKKWQPFGAISLMVTAITIVKFTIGGLITPDLLTIVWVLIFACLLVRDMNSRLSSYKRSIGLGVISVLGFYTKAYLLPFFAAGYGICWLYRIIWAKETRRDSIKHAVMVGIVVILLLSPWLLMLHQKYGKWMLGSSNQFNMSYVGPNSDKHPVSGRLLPPSNKYATNAWEDPTNAVYRRWTPMKSFKDFQYHVFTNVPKNIRDIVAVIALWTPVLFLSLASGLLILLFSRKTSSTLRSDETAKGLLIVNILAAVYLAGYAAVHLVGGERYIWPVLVLSFVLSIITLLYLTIKLTDQWRRVSLTIVGVLSLVSYLCIYINPSLISVANSRKDSELVHAVNKIQKYVPQDTRVAASTIYGGNIAYLLNLKLYGSKSGLVAQNPAAMKKLKEYSVKYFFCYNRTTACGFSHDMLVTSVYTKRDGLLQVFKVED